MRAVYPYTGLPDWPLLEKFGLVSSWLVEKVLVGLKLACLKKCVWPFTLE